MSKLQFEGRWMNCTPRWLGNRDQEEPFTVRIRRLTVAEKEAFMDAWRALLAADRGGKATPDELAQIFAPVLQGPFGELEVDGEAIAAGNLGALLRFAARESQYVGEPLAGELAREVAAMNSLNDEAEGKSERRPGGSGTSSDQVAAANGSTSAPQPDAPAAEPSSPAEEITS